ncbi:MAG: amidase [Lachnospiraceae bacterium]|nr:amidase [Lachnospiraceae bacterium]
MELYRLSGVELGREVNRGNIAPTEVIRYFADRIEKRNPSLNAFTYTKIEEAMEEAESLEERLAKGEKIGPLASVPVGLKDFLPSKKGWPNSHGGVHSLIRIDNEDSVFYAAAREAGAIAVGKTNSPAFAFRGTCDNKLYGPTSTPFDTRYNSGGSSGGSAAAVADGMITIGQGSDGGGSIRIPASWCGCFGFKASVGTIPAVNRPDGWMATHPYCFDGAITRTVEDSAVVLEYMARYNPRDPLSLDHGHRNFTELMKRPLKGIKIAFTPDFGVFSVDKEVEKMVRSAAVRFREAGAVVDEDVRFNFRSSQNEMAELWCRSISVDTAIDMELWKKEGFDLVRDHREELPEEFIYWNEIALRSTIMDYRRFNEIRTEMLDAQQDVFERYDLIVSPVTVCPPVLNEKDGNTKGPLEVNGHRTEQLIGFCETFIENFTGNPAASVPAGLTSEGLPVGMQIIGKRFRDEDVLAASYSFEQIMPWSYEVPWSREI